jgi:hypothetical protein
VAAGVAELLDDHVDGEGAHRPRERDEQHQEHQREQTVDLREEVREHAVILAASNTWYRILRGADHVEPDAATES